MAGLLTVEQLQQKRKEKLEAIKLKQASNASSSVQGSMSDDDAHTVTVNTPPEPAILSVVSWNVQTFEAGKSLSSPFANLVINRILEDLAVDVCVLLETRADSYVNMNAIETGEIGQGNWKAVSEEADLEDDDESGGSRISKKRTWTTPSRMPSTRATTPTWRCPTRLTPLTWTTPAPARMTTWLRWTVAIRCATRRWSVK